MVLKIDNVLSVHKPLSVDTGSKTHFLLVVLPHIYIFTDPEKKPYDVKIGNFGLLGQ